MSEAGALTEILRRESRSYLQYVRESFPWAKGKDEAVRQRVLEAALAEGNVIDSLCRSLQKRHIPLPALGGFPASFTTSNFIAVDYLVPKLIVAQKQAIAALEANLGGVSDAELHKQLRELRDLKVKHLKELESLRGAP